jgi:hypothetical protein
LRFLQFGAIIDKDNQEQDMNTTLQSIIINPTDRTICSGTSLQGYVSITFAELCEALGEPGPYVSGDGKVIAEWILQDNKVVATIYIYKLTEIPQDTYSWHVGGFNEKALELVQRLLPNHKVESRLSKKTA